MFFKLSRVETFFLLLNESSNFHVITELCKTAPNVVKPMIQSSECS